MPYVVTTKRPDKWREEDDVVLSRRAVATFDVARAIVAERINDQSPPNTHPAVAQYDCLDDPEFGGTVGTLPDGTVIDVSPRETSDLAASVLMANDYHFGEATEAEVIAAYNAKAGQ